jgi:membrane protein DedA with SNARE-associated domain
MKTKHILSLIFGLLLSGIAFGQDQVAELAGEDKYNVVIGVLSVIFICIVIYLIVLDRKIRRLEKQKNSN